MPVLNGIEVEQLRRLWHRRWERYGNIDVDKMHAVATKQHLLTVGLGRSISSLSRLASNITSSEEAINNNNETLSRVIVVSYSTSSDRTFRNASSRWRLASAPPWMNTLRNLCALAALRA